MILSETCGLSIDGCSCEIAEVTEVSIGTVMLRLARARGRIMSIMRTRPQFDQTGTCWLVFVDLHLAI